MSRTPNNELEKWENDYSASYPSKLPVHRFEMKIPADLWDAMNRAKPATSPMATWAKDVIVKAIEAIDSQGETTLLGCRDAALQNSLPEQEVYG